MAGFRWAAAENMDFPLTEVETICVIMAMVCIMSFALVAATYREYLKRKEHDNEEYNLIQRIMTTYFAVSLVGIAAAIPIALMYGIGAVVMDENVLMGILIVGGSLNFINAILINREDKVYCEKNDL